jgi:hypothetical protein
MDISWGLSCVYDWGWILESVRLHGPCAGEQVVVEVSDWFLRIEESKAD